jgi:hypothetical protein
MKLGLILAVGILTSVVAARQAEANCALTINGSSTYAYVGRGQSFSFGIDLLFPSSGPQPPPGPQIPQFIVVFMGTNIPASGETYPGLFGYGHSDLGGYFNPFQGGFTGVYWRYADIYTSAGYICTTNWVAVELQ